MIRKLASVAVAVSVLSSAAVLPAAAVQLGPPKPPKTLDETFPGNPGGPGDDGPGRSQNGWGDELCKRVPWICR